MKAKKALGQHFLIDNQIAYKIANAFTLLSECNNVLEVGPGKGILTNNLLENDLCFKAVELDRDMVAYLKKANPILENKLIHINFLHLDLNEPFKGEPFLLIGNYPYNISTQIVFKMIENRILIPQMVGMFQKEVAERIVAPHGSKTYGVTSVLTQAFYEGEYLFDVEASSFSPPPKVVSGVIRLTRKKGPLGCDYKLLRQIVKLSFNHRRKMLRNTLKPIVKNETILTDKLFTLRPEHLSVSDFINLTQQIAESNES